MKQFEHSLINICFHIFLFSSYRTLYFILKFSFPFYIYFVCVCVVCFLTGDRFLCVVCVCVNVRVFSCVFYYMLNFPWLAYYVYSVITLLLRLFLEQSLLSNNINCSFCFLFILNYTFFFFFCSSNLCIYLRFFVLL